MPTKKELRNVVKMIKAYNAFNNTYLGLADQTTGKFKKPVYVIFDHDAVLPYHIQLNTTDGKVIDVPVVPRVDIVKKPYFDPLAHLSPEQLEQRLENKNRPPDDDFTPGMN